MIELVRLCPKCGSERPSAEIVCENLIEASPCRWPLEHEDLRAKGAPRAPVSDMAVASCLNGHPIVAGDQMCLVCGISIEPIGDSAPPLSPQVLRDIGNWRLHERLSVREGLFEQFGVEESATARRGVLTLYAAGQEPDPAVHAVLRRMPRDHIAELFETGRHEGRAYEIIEAIAHGSLADIRSTGLRDPPSFETIVEELGRALGAMTEAGQIGRASCRERVCLAV